MIKKIGIISAIIVLLVGTSYYGYRQFQRRPPQTAPPVAVNAVETKLQKWYTQIKATGTLSSFRGIMISSEVSGRVTAINFESGTFVKEGEPLFQIYPDILEAQLEQYKAMTQLAALDYARGLKLYQKSVISRQDLDQLTSTLAQDRALVAQTQAKLVQHNITAPFSGLAGLRLVNEGAYVTAGQNLVSFQQLSPLRVQFSIPENYLPLLAKNQKIHIIASATPNMIEEGTVYAFDSAIDPNTRSIAIRAEIPNKNQQLIPGGFAEVILFAGQERDVITIPQTAINYSTLGTSVYVIQPNKTVKSVPVLTGDRLGNEIEILSGLKPGEVIVIGGQIKLYEGAQVKIEPLYTGKKATSPSNMPLPSRTNPQSAKSSTATAQVNNFNIQSL